MMQNRLQRALILFLLCALSSRALAEMNVVESLEWLTGKADLVVLGNIAKTPLTAPANDGYKDYKIQVVCVLKGSTQSKDLSLRLRTLSDTDAAFLNLLQAGRPPLLLLSKWEAANPEKQRPNTYVPTSESFPLSLIDLSHLPAKYLYSKEMKIPGTSKEILEIVRQWSSSKISFSLLIPISRINSTDLEVPAEESYRPYFIKLTQSPNPAERQRAAEELSKYPGPETEAVLRELLVDKSEKVWSSSEDTIAYIKFGVRSAAWQSLKTLGKEVPPIDLQRLPTLAEQQAARQNAWQRAFQAALPDGWKISSIRDGKIRRLEDQDKIVVIVTCKTKAAETCRLILMPKEWPKDDFPKEENLGINGLNNSGSRYFFFDGKNNPELKEKLVAYFGLEKS